MNFLLFLFAPLKLVQYQYYSGLIRGSCGATVAQGVSEEKQCNLGPSEKSLPSLLSTFESVFWVLAHSEHRTPYIGLCVSLPTITCCLEAPIFVYWFVFIKKCFIHFFFTFLKRHLLII